MDVKISKLRRENKTIWCKLAGFAFWPARICNQSEEDALSILRPPSTKLRQVAVSFLGGKCEKAWVGESSVFEFTPASLLANEKLFSDKKFKGEKDYRSAVLEGVRIVSVRNASTGGGEGDAFPATMLDKLIPPVNSNVGEDICVYCRGSEQSGLFFACANCSGAMLHLHCASPPVVDINMRWYCNPCCKVSWTSFTSFSFFFLNIYALLLFYFYCMPDAGHPTRQGASAAWRVFCLSAFCF